MTQHSSPTSNTRLQERTDELQIHLTFAPAGVGRTAPGQGSDVPVSWIMAGVGDGTVHRRIPSVHPGRQRPGKAGPCSIAAPTEMRMYQSDKTRGQITHTGPRPDAFGCRLMTGSDRPAAIDAERGDIPDSPVQVLTGFPVDGHLARAELPGYNSAPYTDSGRHSPPAPLRIYRRA
jgi:hypothetical protein